MATYRIERFENTSFTSVPISIHREFDSDEDALNYATRYAHEGPNGRVNVYRLVAMIARRRDCISFENDYSTGGDHLHSISVW